MCEIEGEKERARVLLFLLFSLCVCVKKVCVWASRGSACVHSRRGSVAPCWIVDRQASRPAGTAVGEGGRRGPRIGQQRRRAGGQASLCFGMGGEEAIGRGQGGGAPPWEAVHLPPAWEECIVTSKRMSLLSFSSSSPTSTSFSAGQKGRHSLPAKAGSSMSCKGALSSNH